MKMQCFGISHASFCHWLNSGLTISKDLKRLGTASGSALLAVSMLVACGKNATDSVVEDAAFDSDVASTFNLYEKLKDLTHFLQSYEKNTALNLRSLGSSVGDSVNIGGTTFKNINGIFTKAKSWTGNSLSATTSIGDYLKKQNAASKNLTKSDLSRTLKYTVAFLNAGGDQRAVQDALQGFDGTDSLNAVRVGVILKTLAAAMQKDTASLGLAPESGTISCVKFVDATTRCLVDGVFIEAGDPRLKPKSYQTINAAGDAAVIGGLAGKKASGEQTVCTNEFVPGHHREPGSCEWIRNKPTTCSDGRDGGSDEKCTSNVSKSSAGSGKDAAGEEL